MRVLVAYGSHLGSTAEVAERIGSVLREARLEVTVHAAAVAEPEPATGGFDGFVVGSGTYGGRWHPDAVAFIRQHAEVLVRKPVWLFSTGPVGSRSAASEAREPAEITELARLVRARDHVVFAGALDRGTVDGSELGRIERFVAKRFIPEGDWRDWPKIEGWARGIAVELQSSAIGAL